MKEEYLSMETVNKLAELEHIKEKMNNQVKITINNKEYYCDMEVLKLIERLSDKVELLEYNRDKTIEYIENDMPYLEEPDEEFERCDGTTYMTMKEYDTSILLKKIRGEKNDKSE